MRSRGGFVLFAALWLIVALSAAGLDAALRSQAGRLAATNRVDGARAREAALAGSEYARARLTAAVLDRAEQLRAEVARTGATGARLNQAVRMATTQDDPWRSPHELLSPSFALGEAEFVLSVSDTGLRLNLNSASESMLRNFFAQGLRIDYAWADRLAQAILDWRDADELPRINGAELEQYLKEGAAVLPPNRQFARVDELRHVMGMTPELFAAAQPYLTVRGSGRVSVSSAPTPVLLALPGFTPAAVAELERRRAAGEFPRNTTELRMLLIGIWSAPEGPELANFNRSVSFATNEVEIVSRGRIAGSVVQVVATTIVARSDQGATVVWRKLE